MYSYFPRVSWSEKAVCSPWSMKQEFFHRKSNSSPCFIELLLSHNRTEKKETREFPFIILLEIKASISLSSPYTDIPFTLYKSSSCKGKILTLAGQEPLFIQHWLIS